MNPLQPVHVRDVGELLEYLPDHERQIVDALRSIIFSCIPGCREKIAYNVPFYSRRKRICFIWPASVPWGKVKKGVRLGFSNGYLLSDELNYLEKGGRKHVYCRDFTSVQDINVDLLKTFLFEAVVVDEELALRKLLKT
nr:DUF1801 domain-containing protein [uncultured Arsenicibacter sp.]